jgi:hypothetical protein
MQRSRVAKMANDKGQRAANRGFTRMNADCFFFRFNPRESAEIRGKEVEFAFRLLPCLPPFAWLLQIFPCLPLLCPAAARESGNPAVRVGNPSKEKPQGERP